MLISTSRHTRQMPVDIKDFAYDKGKEQLSGISRAVVGDPYQMRIFIPDGFKAEQVQLSEGLQVKMKTVGNLLTWILFMLPAKM